jgi:hypothetical protein
MVEEQGQKTKTKAVEEQEQKQKWWKNYDINGANRNQTNRGTRNQKKNTKEEKKLIHVAPPQGLVDGVDVRSKSTTMNLKATFWSKKFGS